jgi:hypothetical protein
VELHASSCPQISENLHNRLPAKDRQQQVLALAEKEDVWLLLLNTQETIFLLLLLRQKKQVKRRHVKLQPCRKSI